MTNAFKPGDIVAPREGESSIGYVTFLTGDKVSLEKQKAKYRQWRGKVLKIEGDEFDKDGVPCVRLQRLDTKGHGRELWSQGFLVLASGEEG